MQRITKQQQHWSVQGWNFIQTNVNNQQQLAWNQQHTEPMGEDKFEARKRSYIPSWASQESSMCIPSVHYPLCTVHTGYICSTQSENLCNLEIALCILRILRLGSNLKIADYSSLMSRLGNYSA